MTDPIAQAAEDIRAMRVRGAARIGRHAVAALAAFSRTWRGDPQSLEAAAARLLETRPTAVSLRNAVAFAVSRAQRAPPSERARALAAAAEAFEARAREALAELGRHGARLIPEDGTVLTICNSQGALAPVLEAHLQGKAVRVVALETRPWRQGLLTARQLAAAGVPCDLAVDSAAWSLLGGADLVLTGADTIAGNGDVVNKIGTGGLAVLAEARGVPLHVCAETFKFDPRAPDGASVAIEERDTAEVVDADDLPAGVGVQNPVFDVTSHARVRGYVTELGLLTTPSELREAALKAWEWP